MTRPARHQGPIFLEPPIRAGLAGLYRVPTNGIKDCPSGVVPGQRYEDYAAGARRAQPRGSEACGQKFGYC